MVIAAPRSGTTWAANWLTTDTTLCLHDPLWTMHYTELDSIEERCPNYATINRTIGVACTGLAMFPDWVNLHPSRKVILHRNRIKINESLIELGLPILGSKWDGALDKIEGEHHDWMDLFNAPKEIYEFLLDRPFDASRHRLLAEIHMQPNFARLHIQPENVRMIIDELRSN